MATPRKQLIVVAGPNGAGKTTFALKYAAEYGLAYLGADAIAYERAPEDRATEMTQKRFRSWWPPNSTLGYAGIVPFDRCCDIIY